MNGGMMTIDKPFKNNARIKALQYKTRASQEIYREKSKMANNV
jgi:hypothetical protein